MDNEDQFPQSFYCPLTLQLMKDPVVDPEGNSFEREAVEDWLKRNETSPVTRNPLKMSDLIPNRALKDAIEDKKSALAKKGEKIPEKKPAPKTPENKTEQTNENKSEKNSNSNPAVDTPISVNISGNREDEEESVVMVSVKPPVGVKRTPVDICCVVDISGSMGTEAKTQNSSGSKEGHGLSILDIVKHAVKTIINVMDPADRLSVVSFTTTAKVEFGLIGMDDNGKKKAEMAVSALQPDDQTNLWDGLEKGLEVLRKGHSKGRLSSVLLLTDGQPNVVPPRGHLPMLKRYKDEHQPLNATINCFGFGYSMDSQLLNDLAVEGNGMYVLIPDSGFVGTAFVNATSNLLVTMARNAQISLEPQNGATIVPHGVLGGYPTQYNSWGALVNFDTIQYDQTKNIIVKMKIPKDLPTTKPYLTATVTYETKDSSKALQIVAEGSRFENAEEIQVQIFRVKTVDTIREAIKKAKDNLAEAKDLVKGLIKDIKTKEPKDARVKALLQDLEGQVIEALSRQDFYDRWGIHYLPSLANAHLLQICNNFKDPGVQIYGGKLFQQLRDRADDIFVKMPPPKPSARPTAKPVQSMSYYHSSANPCFAGPCQVLMPNATTKRVDQIKKGDIVMTLSGKPAEVVCVIKTVSADGMTDLVELGGLLITPFHPVKIGDRWEFPCNLGEVQKRPCDAVYSFVLK